MAKNKTRQNTAASPQPRAPQPRSAQDKKQAAPPADDRPLGKFSAQVITAAAIAIVTFLFFKVCFDNQLTNWDDPGYIRDNRLIKDISTEGLKNIFSTSVMGNYHPLTILTYAIEYSFVGLDPWLYHVTSVLFHIGVTILVFWFVNILTRRPVAAAITALLFGLHPMHVESVAWLAGRKDVVYGFFYIAACIAYVYYIRSEKNRWKWYAGVIILFICSLLAKPVAVTLPVVMLIIDYFERRFFIKKANENLSMPGQVADPEKSTFNKAVVFEKIPHFLIAIGFGIQSIRDQISFQALDTHNVSYNILERIGLGGYALITYLWKAVIPSGLSNFYPYPEKAGASISAIYYVFPLAVILIIFLVWKFARKNRPVVFGLLFFLANIALLLQFIPVGGAIIADRYSYIPYLGLFFIAGYYVSSFFEPGKNRQMGLGVAGAAIVYALVLGYQSHERSKVWYDTTTLWTDEIEKHPDAPNAYNNLGFNYFNKFNESVDPAARKVYFDSSLMLLTKATQLQNDFANPLVSLGELYRAAGDFNKAKTYYYEALKLNDKEGAANAYLGLAIIYAISRNFDSSGYCFKQAIASKEYFPEAHSNFGNYYDMIGKHEESLTEYGIAISQNPDMYAPYLNRARKLTRMKRCDEALQDFDKAAALNPEMGEIYYFRSYCHSQKGNKAQALQDVETGLRLGYTQIDNNYYQLLKSGR
jgi:tetratricopeptide (TPR) repeat protein